MKPGALLLLTLWLMVAVAFVTVAVVFWYAIEIALRFSRAAWWVLL